MKKMRHFVLKNKKGKTVSVVSVEEAIEDTKDHSSVISLEPGWIIDTETEEVSEEEKIKAKKSL